MATPQLSIYKLPARSDILSCGATTKGNAARYGMSLVKTKKIVFVDDCIVLCSSDEDLENDPHSNDEKSDVKRVVADSGK